ncbi:FMN-binding negative transcriptional regulator [Salaquimonas pukyongi]|uniref:FMN-binding negative transcriptional regulator n=1 Tax=Salaquimonas pukyongi TaxID=2712698 RepID=UPI00096B74B8|nr:FMN-binding negative transcriptional regulator [Salaquimonas pukyongi]
MHPNPVFRKQAQAANISFARSRSFGVLAVNGDGGPLLSHIPFALSEDGAWLEAHLVRSNPILRLLGQAQPAVIAVAGSDAYISPDWYGVDDQVPTWNYVAVHLRGTLKRLPDEELHPILERLSENFEARLAPKKPWTITKMDQDIYQRMLRQIVPIAMDITQIDGTWKLSQNKPEAACLGAADGLAGIDPSVEIGSEMEALVSLMRGAGDSEGAA